MLILTFICFRNVKEVRIVQQFLVVKNGYPNKQNFVMFKVFKKLELKILQFNVSLSILK